MIQYQNYLCILYMCIYIYFVPMHGCASGSVLRDHTQETLYSIRDQMDWLYAGQETYHLVVSNTVDSRV